MTAGILIGTQLAPLPFIPRVTMICDFPPIREGQQISIFHHQSVGFPESVGENKIHNKQ